MYYEPPDDVMEQMDGYDISRVIELPGESLEIIKGQIYIEGKRLDTFYGRWRNP